MCEIAIVPTDGTDRYDSRETAIAGILKLAQSLYDSNPHGLGVVAVRRDEEAGRFDYRVFKTGWTEAGMSDAGVYEFVDEEYDNSWRMVIHARYATAGNVDREGTHPIITADIDDVPWTGVIHNGVVRGHKASRRKLEREEDREFTTEVDSEVIAHKASKPDPDQFGTDVDDWEVPSLRGSLNYVLFSPYQILIYSDGKYHVTDDCTMACSHRNFNTHKPATDEDGWFLFTPDGSVAHREDERHYKYTTPKTTTTTRGKSFGSRFGAYGRINSGQSRLPSKQGQDGESDSDDGGDSGNANWWGASSPKRETSSDTADRTRETLGRSAVDENPPIDSDESYARYEHRGYFVGGDYLLCLEHGHSFIRMCPVCGEESITNIEDVGLVFEPDAFMGATGSEGQVWIRNHDDSDRHYTERTVMRCPHTQEWFVDESECPVCGVDHQEVVAQY